MYNNYQINKKIIDYKSKDYADNILDGEIILDCSLGVNQDQIEENVFNVLKSFEAPSENNPGKFLEIKSYPHDDSIKNELVEWYKNLGIDFLTKDNFILGNGSYDILCNLNRLFLTNEKKVLGHAPQFTAYIDSVNCSDSIYESYRIPKENNYTFDCDAYLSSMNESYSLFIIENPNNPTGQIIPLIGLKKIGQKAKELNRVLVVDEAYGEYLKPEESAINLIKELDNVIVTRSFSKGWGMAGIRLGYAITSRENGIFEQLEKIELGFCSNALARLIAKTAVKSKIEKADPFNTELIKSKKMILKDALNEIQIKYGYSFKIANTNNEVPILMLYNDDNNRDINLQEELFKQGILTVSCSTYDGLDKNAVRIMLPNIEEMPALVKGIEESIKKIIL